MFDQQRMCDLLFEGVLWAASHARSIEWGLKPFMTTSKDRLLLAEKTEVMRTGFHTYLNTVRLNSKLKEQLLLRLLRPEYEEWAGYMRVVRLTLIDVVECHQHAFAMTC